MTGLSFCATISVIAVIVCDSVGASIDFEVVASYASSDAEEMLVSNAMADCDALRHHPIGKASWSVTKDTSLGPESRKSPSGIFTVAALQFCLQLGVEGSFSSQRVMPLTMSLLPLVYLMRTLTGITNRQNCLFTRAGATRKTRKLAEKSTHCGAGLLNDL